MKKIFLFTKPAFYFANMILIILYLYPGSIIGWFVFGDFQKQPQITENIFDISSNHIYAFLVLSILGIFSFEKRKIKGLFIYLFSSAVFLEILQIIIPKRSFEYIDLFGNVIGVFLIFLIFIIYIFFKKNYD